MESNVPPQSQVTDSAYSFSSGQHEDRLTMVSREMEILNTIGKRFVAAIDRFHVHRALLRTLQEMYSFSACCILLKGEPVELFIIPCQPLSASFIQEMLERIVKAAHVMDFPSVTVEQLAETAYFDAPDEVAQYRTQEAIECTEVGSSLSIPLTVENRIIGLLSLFDELIGTFDTDMLKLTTMIADYAAVALENVRLRERENALWRQAELERQRLELIISSMAEGLLITDARGAITSFNRSAREWLAQEHIDLQANIPLRELANKSNIAWLYKLSDIVDSALAGKRVLNQELVIGDGREAVPPTLSISASPLIDASGAHARPIGVVAVLDDVTASKQVERLKDEFVSVVSHELRTPLTAIKGYVQHLIRRIERRLRKGQQGKALPAEMPESYDLRSLHIVQSQTEHLERLVCDLIDLSQMQGGQLTLQYSDFFLSDLLAESVHSAQISAEQHTIFLDIQVQDTKVTADRSRIGQVIGNILDNAIKYSPQGEQVRVVLQEQEGEYLISVIDQGLGVSPELFDHIFERFYRVRNIASRQYAGIGLGLHVAKAIVEAHGGQLWFTNNTSIGSTFYFTLPRQPHEASS
jgi:two-component system phosphate regulon sensor histidine kinase PhoR